MNRHQLIKLLVGRNTVAFARSKRIEQRQYPAAQLQGESRWEVRDSDTQEPGPYAMRDENAADELTSERYYRALSDLSRSCEAQPVGSPHLPQDTLW